MVMQFLPPGGCFRWYGTGTYQHFKKNYPKKCQNADLLKNKIICKKFLSREQDEKRKVPVPYLNDDIQDNVLKTVLFVYKRSRKRTRNLSLRQRNYDN
jgi:hypothetical protein